jgi:hypothetical protein
MFQGFMQTHTIIFVLTAYEVSLTTKNGKIEILSFGDFHSNAMERKSFFIHFPLHSPFVYFAIVSLSYYCSMPASIHP